MTTGGRRARCLRHERPSLRPPRDHHRPAQSHRGRHRRQRRQGAPRARKGAADGADLVIFPELFIAGYPPEDLVLKPAFQAACRAAVEALARETGDGGPSILVGTPWFEDGKLYNAVALLEDGVIAALRFKVDLPNYGVFDEKRVFAPGPLPGPVSFRGVRIGGADLRGHLGPGPGRVHRRDRRRNPAGAQCLALSPRRHRRAAQHRGAARHRGGPAAGLRQPGGRTGRARVRRARRSRSMPTARSRSSFRRSARRW